VSDGLLFDLGLGTKTARAEMKALVADFQKQLDSLTYNPRAKSGGKSEVKSEAEKLIASEEKARKQIEKIIADSWTQVINTETMMGRKLIAEREQLLDKLQSMKGLYVDQPDAFKRFASQQVTQYKSDLTTDAASDRADMTRRAAELRGEEAHVNRLYEIRANALYRIEQLEFSSGTNLTSQKQQIENRLKQISMMGTNARLSDVTREVNGIIAGAQRAARARETAAGGGVNGKSLQYVFQAQQAIEDFSYAGLRGASNNIALMASQLGGAGGLIALLGITAVQLGPLIAGLQDTSKESENFAKRVEALNKGLVDLAQVDTTSGWRKFDSKDLVKSADDMKKAVADARQELTDLGTTKVNLDWLKQQFEIVGRLGKQINSLPGGQGNQDYSALQAQIATIRDRIREVWPEWNGIFGTTKEIEKTIADINTKLNENEVATQKGKAALNDMLPILQQRLELMKKVTAIEEQAGLARGQAFVAYSDSENTADKNMIRKLEADKQHWERVANDALKAGDMVGFNAAATKAREAANDAQKLRDLVEAVKRAEQEQLDQARDALRLQKEKNAEKERELRTAEELMKTLEREARAQRVDSATSDIDTRQGMANNMLNKMKERDQQLISMSPNQDWQKAATYQMNAYYDAMQARQDRYFAREKEMQLQSKADAAAATDPKEQRQYLEDLQRHQQQQAMNARTPQEAQYWYNKSLQTQKMIEESFAKQKQQQQEKIDGIRNEIKSVEDLERRVEELSDEIRGIPKLDLQDPATLQYLSQVKAELREIIMLKQQAEMKGGSGGGAGGGNPFGGFDWGGNGGSPFGGFGGGSNPFAGMDWGNPMWGGQHPQSQGSPTNIGPDGDVSWPLPSSPPGGWGFGGAMTSGLTMPQSFTTQSMQGSHQSMPQGAFGGGNGTQFNSQTSIGNMPIYLSGGNFNMNDIANSARMQANNALLRRGL
jgi:hypothetical protein